MMVGRYKMGWAQGEVDMRKYEVEVGIRTG